MGGRRLVLKWRRLLRSWLRLVVCCHRQGGRLFLSRLGLVRQNLLIECLLECSLLQSRVHKTGRLQGSLLQCGLLKHRLLIDGLVYVRINCRGARVRRRRRRWGLLGRLGLIDRRGLVDRRSLIARRHQIGRRGLYGGWGRMGLRGRRLGHLLRQRRHLRHALGQRWHER